MTYRSFSDSPRKKKPNPILPHLTCAQSHPSTQLSTERRLIHVSDCVEAILIAVEKSRSQVEVCNVGSEDEVDVKFIARIVIEEMGLGDVKLKFTGGVDGGRGWIGDVKHMRLDIRKLESLGWKPNHNSREAIRLAVREELQTRKAPP